MRRHVVSLVLLGTLAAAGLAAPGPALAAAGAASTHTNGLIAYRCVQGSAVRWVVVRPDGSGAVVRAPAEGTAIGDLAWAPDGSELAYTGDVFAGGRSSVTLAEADGSRPFAVTNFDRTVTPTVDRSPAWTPTGEGLVFTRAGQVVADNAYGFGPTPVPQPAGTNAAPDVSVTGDVVFADATPAAWLLRAGEGAASPLASNAAQATFSPDGQQVAFVRGDQVWTVPTSGGTPTQVTTGTGTLHDVDYAPDGTAFVLARAGGVFTVAASGGAETRVSASTCTGTTSASWQPVPVDPDAVTRVSGSDRIATAIAVSSARYPADHDAAAVVLARSDGFADALAGTPLAVHEDAPLLLTPSGSTVDPRVLAEIDRVLPTSGPRPVFVLGGTGAVSQAIEDELVAHGLTVRRLAGTTRYATAVAVARYLGAGGASPDALFLATGMDFPDALSAGAAAGSYWLGGPSAHGGAVLLTAGTMPADVAAYLAEARGANPDLEISAVGGSAAAVAAAALPAGSVLRLVGIDRYTTAAYVAESHFGAQTAVGIATGTGFADALAGGVLAASLNAPLLLTRPTALPTGEATGYLYWFSGSIRDALVFGGTGAVTAAVVTQLRTAIGLNTRSLEVSAGLPATGTPDAKHLPSTTTTTGPTTDRSTR